MEDVTKGPLPLEATCHLEDILVSRMGETVSKGEQGGARGSKGE